MIKAAYFCDSKIDRGKIYIMYYELCKCIDKKLKPIKEKGQGHLNEGVVSNISSNIIMKKK